jgi:hypothetical protein
VVAEYPEFLFYAWDDEREEVVGVGHSIPAAWNGDTASLPNSRFKTAPSFMNAGRSGSGALRLCA